MLVAAGIGIGRVDGDYEAELELKRRRMPMLAVYHFHRGGTATLSWMDRHLANRTVAFQLVVAVGSPPQYQIMMRAYDHGGRPAVILLAT